MGPVAEWAQSAQSQEWIQSILSGKAYLCTCTHTRGGTLTKNISMTDDAYKALRRERKSNESFTETILRLTERGGKLSDCFGAWKMSRGEEVAIMKELSEGWDRAKGRIRNEMP